MLLECHDTRAIHLPGKISRAGHVSLLVMRKSMSQLWQRATQPVTGARWSRAIDHLKTQVQANKYSGKRDTGLKSW